MLNQSLSPSFFFFHTFSSSFCCLFFHMNLGTTLFSSQTLVRLKREQEFDFIFLFLNLFIYLFLAVLGLRFCARALSSCGRRGPPTIAASLVAAHRLQTRRPSNCGPRAQLLCSTQDPPRPGLEPASPAPAGRLATTAPPGKPLISLFKKQKNHHKKIEKTNGKEEINVCNSYSRKKG